ncbi:MAG: aminotransferase class I/II-fold pyridoxal phosphate-dependent enzyme [Rikenellaceae bacterium]
MINGHGNNIYQFAEGEIELDFSSNIPFNHHAEQIIEQLKTDLSSVMDYPDPEARRLSALVAASHNRQESEVLITNGSAEAFYLVAHLLSKLERCRTIITTPSFSEYEDSCSLYGHSISFERVDKIFDCDLAHTDTLWLATPNNPDGRRIAFCDIIALAEREEQCYIVVDMAYNALSLGAEPITHTPKSIIVINSFTKEYAIPGLRLGYILANTELIAELKQQRAPWSVSALALVAGEYIMHNAERLKPDLNQLIASSKSLQREIDQIEGFRVNPSDSNFFLVEIEGSSAAALQRYLIEKEGILIRDCSNFRGLNDRTFRLATRSRKDNNRLIEALKRWQQIQH